MTTGTQGLATCMMCGGATAPVTDLDGRLLRCTDCGFRCNAGALGDPALIHDAEYFAQFDYFDKPAERRREAGLRLRWIVAESGKPDSLVEAGCAGGYFLDTARKAGIRVSGVEISATAAAHARSELGLDVRLGAFEELPAGDPVAAVCAFHVLEHVEDPELFINRARQSLRPGGRIFLEVPNMDSAAARRLGLLWPGLALDQHRWHFSGRDISRLLSNNGFEVESIDTVFSRFYWRPLRRLRSIRSLHVADWAASGSLRVRHPDLGDFLRVVAVWRRPRTPRCRA